MAETCALPVPPKHPRWVSIKGALADLTPSLGTVVVVAGLFAGASAIWLGSRGFATADHVDDKIAAAQRAESEHRAELERRLGERLGKIEAVNQAVGDANIRDHGEIKQSMGKVQDLLLQLLREGRK